VEISRRREKNVFVYVALLALCLHPIVCRRAYWKYVRSGSEISAGGNIEGEMSERVEEEEEGDMAPGNCDFTTRALLQVDLIASMYFLQNNNDTI